MVSSLWARQLSCVGENKPHDGQTLYYTYHTHISRHKRVRLEENRVKTGYVWGQYGRGPALDGWEQYERGLAVCGWGLYWRRQYGRGQNGSTGTVRGNWTNPTDTMPEMLMPWSRKLIYIHEEDERSRLWREQEFVLQGRILYSKKWWMKY